MACNALDHATQNGDNATTADQPGTGEGHTGPNLIVSNAPETLAGQVGNSEILYRAILPLGSNLSFRVFLWHVNEKGGNRFFRIVARYTGSSSITASSRRYSEEVVGMNSDLTAAGKRLACIQNYGAFDHTQSNLTIGSTTVELWSATVPDDDLVGCVYEFSVSTPTGPGNLIVETLFDAGSIPTGDPVDPEDPDNPEDPAPPPIHIRGWWPYSEILFPVSGTLDANPESSDPHCKEIGVVQMPSAPELSASAFGYRGTTEDPFGTSGGNKGLYGAKAKYRFSALNDHSTLSNWLSLKVRMRNNGGFFVAAGKTTSPNGENRLVPKLSANGQIKYSDLDTGADMEIGPDETKTVTCELSPGGAATLPVNLQFCSGRLS